MATEIRKNGKSLVNREPVIRGADETMIQWVRDVREMLRRVELERHFQDQQWGGGSHDDSHDPFAWIAYITKQLGKAANSAGAGSPEDAPFCGASASEMVAYQNAMIKAAALAVAAAQCVERKLGKK